MKEEAPASTDTTNIQQTSTVNYFTNFLFYEE
jgi:hypothetical protein